MKLSVALDGYWLAKRLDMSPHTIRDYELTFRRLVAYLGDMEVEHITATQIRRFLEHLAGEYDLSKRTLSNVWIALSSFWTWAEIELNVPHIIRGQVEQPKYTDKIPDPFTRAEVRELIRTVEYSKGWIAPSGKRTESRRPTAARDKAIILVLTDTGIRAQELCDLTIRDYGAHRGRLHIRHGKGDKERYVTLGDRAKKALWRYLADRGKTKPSDPLFSAKNGNALDRHNLRRLLDTIGRNAGVSNVYPHRFRHTFAIEFLRNGGNLLLLKELLGHESLEMVMRYARIAEADIDESARHSPADNWRI
jgi:integrase/recombinase XerD